MKIPSLVSLLSFLMGVAVQAQNPDMPPPHRWGGPSFDGPQRQNSGAWGDRREQFRNMFQHFMQQRGQGWGRQPGFVPPSRSGGRAGGPPQPGMPGQFGPGAHNSRGGFGGPGHFFSPGMQGGKWGQSAGNGRGGFGSRGWFFGPRMQQRGQHGQHGGHHRHHGHGDRGSWFHGKGEGDHKAPSASRAPWMHQRGESGKPGGHTDAAAKGAPKGGNDDLRAEVQRLSRQVEELRNMLRTRMNDRSPGPQMQRPGGMPQRPQGGGPDSPTRNDAPEERRDRPDGGR